MCWVGRMAMMFNGHYLKQVVSMRIWVMRVINQIPRRMWIIHGCRREIAIASRPPVCIVITIMLIIKITTTQMWRQMRVTRVRVRTISRRDYRRRSRPGPLRDPAWKCCRASRRIWAITSPDLIRFIPLASTRPTPRSVRRSPVHFHSITRRCWPPQLPDIQRTPAIPTWATLELKRQLVGRRWCPCARIRTARAASTRRTISRWWWAFHARPDALNVNSKSMD